MSSADPQKFNWRFFCLPILFLLWANLHPGFMVGVILLAIWLVALIVKLIGKRISSLYFFSAVVASGLSVVAALVNPFGYELYASIFKLTRDPYFMNLNVEWLRTDFHDTFFLPYLVSIILVLLLVMTKPTALSFFEVLSSSIFLFLSISYRRYIPFWAIVTSVIIGKAVHSFFLFLSQCNSCSAAIISLRNRVRAGFSAIAYKERDTTRYAYTLSLILVLTVITGLTAHIPFLQSRRLGLDSYFPADAVAQLKENKNLGRIFHTPDWGGYLTWVLWPQQKAFIDDRNQINSKELYEDFFAIDQGRDGWKDVINKYNFQWILTAPKSKISSLLSSPSSGWQLFYKDDKAAIFKRDAA